MVSGVTPGASSAVTGDQSSAEKNTVDASKPSIQPRPAGARITTSGSVNHGDFSSTPPDPVASSATAQDPVYAIAAQSVLAQRLTRRDTSLEDVLKLLRFAFNGSALQCDQSLLTEYKELRARMDKSSGGVPKAAVEAKKFLFDCLYARLNEGPVKEQLKACVADAEKPLRDWNNYVGYVKATHQLLDTLLRTAGTANLTANQRPEYKAQKFAQIDSAMVQLDDDPDIWSEGSISYHDEPTVFPVDKMIEKAIEHLTAQVAEKNVAISKFASGVAGAAVANGVASLAPLSEEDAGELRQVLADILFIRENGTVAEITDAIAGRLASFELEHPGTRASAREQVEMALDFYPLTESRNEAVKAGLTQFLNSPPATKRS